MLLLERAIAFLAPHECIVCSREGSLLCEACTFEEFIPVPSRCYRCLRVTKDYRVCMSCRRSVRLKHVWVAQDYQHYAKRLVRLFKYERVKAAALPIARQMADTLPYFSQDVIITHIPTATSRQRHRGYDQSELIARSIARLKGLEYARLLERSGQARQVGASRSQRLAQAQQMFRLETKRDIKGSSILVIDDILTTGASLEAAARVLKQAGAKDVSAAVFAQKH
jgi:ComF family protein